MVLKLVEACRDIWKTSSGGRAIPMALALYQSLKGSTNPEDIRLRRYLWINGSRFDLIDDNKPFVGSEPMPPGRGFYPQGLTREQIEQYVKEHPDKKAAIYSPTTIVRWQGKQLEADSVSHRLPRRFSNPRRETCARRRR